jgi:hypothetical protein
MADLSTGQNAAAEESKSAEPRLHRLKVTYEVDGKVVRVVEKQVSEKYTWFLIGNSSWREW